MASVVHELMKVGIITSLPPQPAEEAFIPKREEAPAAAQQITEPVKTTDAPAPKTERYISQDEMPAGSGDHAADVAANDASNQDTMQGNFVSMMRGRVASIEAALKDMMKEIEKHDGASEPITEPSDEEPKPEEPKAEESKDELATTPAVSAPEEEDEGAAAVEAKTATPQPTTVEQPK